MQWIFKQFNYGNFCVTCVQYFVLATIVMGSCQSSRGMPVMSTDHPEKMGSSSGPVEITLLHFNDVYNIEPQVQEPVGGAARFKTAIEQRANLNPLVIFSGDAFNPSVMSTITKGKQMAEVLNEFGVNCAVYGNHDFDHGVDNLVKLAKTSTFPWLLSNVIDEMTDSPLAEGIPTHIIEWSGKKLGFVGLVEEEWIATLSTVDPDEIFFIDYVEEGKRQAQILRDQGCDYIIALTHMRWPNDIRLAENVGDIDLILGGHDHDYVVKQVNGKYIIKSGTDFRQMSQVTLTFSEGQSVDVAIQEVTIDSSVPEDEKVKAIVEKYQGVMGEKMEHILGHMDVELEGRFAMIRTQETNLGNFITDIMMEATDADFALLNSGTLRSDRIHPRGDFKVRDLMAILPMVDPLVVIQVTGAQVVDILENGVSQFPKLEGRFPQVSGLCFGFNPDQPQGSRVDARFIQVQGEYLQMEKEYKIVTKHYVSEGRDGYTAFKKGQVVLNDEMGPRLSTSVQNHFKSVKILQGEKKAHSQHRQSLIALKKRKNLVRQMSIHDDDMSVLLSPLSSRTSLASPSGHRLLLRRRSSIQSVEEGHVGELLAPQVEGRIFLLDNHKCRELEEARMIHDVQKTTITEQDETTPTNSFDRASIDREV